MNGRIRNVVTASVSLAAALAVGLAFAHDPKERKNPSMELHQIMMSGAKMPMPMTGNVDRDFAMMMTMHHEQAIKMVDVLLANGQSAKLKAMAREMKAAQQQEIKEMAPFAK